MTTMPSSWRLLTAFSKLCEVRRPDESSFRLGLIVRRYVDTARRPRLNRVPQRTVLAREEARGEIMAACASYRTQFVCDFIERSANSILSESASLWSFKNETGQVEVVLCGSSKLRRAALGLGLALLGKSRFA